MGQEETLWSLGVGSGKDTALCRCEQSGGKYVQEGVSRGPQAAWATLGPGWAHSLSPWPLGAHSLALENAKASPHAELSSQKVITTCQK